MSYTAQELIRAIREQRVRYDVPVVLVIPDHGPPCNISNVLYNTKTKNLEIVMEYTDDYGDN